MKASFKISNPDKMYATLTTTATVEEWKRLAAQLPPAEWPSYDLLRAINDVVRQAEKTFYSAENGDE